jgi:hypothetical protein
MWPVSLRMLCVVRQNEIRQRRKLVDRALCCVCSVINEYAYRRQWVGELPFTISAPFWPRENSLSWPCKKLRFSSTYPSNYNLVNLRKVFSADPSGRAVLGVGLRPFACWDCGFESRRGHGCLFLVSVVCCQVEVSATG